ncbi:MAG: hypothetical protein KIH63_000515 [Candidatus Saccharibacteria bacterium]|nr:hypothetical protein [Candidatus Saccharibacteria bacterium]
MAEPIIISEVMDFVGVEGVPRDLRLDDPLLGHLLHGSIAGLADGDIATFHEPFVDDYEARLFGALNYSDGELAQKMLASAVETGPDRNVPTYAYQSFLAEYFTQAGSPFEGFPGTSVAELHSEYAIVDNQPIPFSREPEYVLDLGACLSSRSLVNDQIAMVRQGRHPFTYIPVFRTHFANQIALEEYDRLLGPGAKQLALDRGLYLGREDGAANTTREMVDTQISHDAPVDIADVVLLLNEQHMSRQDVELGLENAFPLLKTRGILVTRGLVRTSDNNLGASAIAEIAEAAGFVPLNEFTHHQPHHHDYSRMMGTPDEDVEMQTRVYTKTAF